MSEPPARQAELSPVNLRVLGRLRVLEALNDGEPLSRGALTHRTGLARATIWSLVADLISEGIVTDSVPAGGSVLATGQHRERPSSLGRPARLVQLVAQAAYAVGLDIARDHLRCAACDLSGKVVHDSGPVAFPVEADPLGALKTAAEMVHKSVAGIPTERLLGVGVGIASPVDQGSDLLRDDGILPNWSGIPIAAEISAAVGLPVRIINDANAGMLAERRSGAARSCNNAIYLRLSAGIGAGIICDGRMLLGSSGLVGELGHVSVDLHGLVCRCGNRGCLETIASPPALAAQLSADGSDPLTSKELLARVAASDPDAVRAVKHAGAAVGTVIAHAVMILNPALLIVGGELAAAGETLLAPMRAAIEEHTMRAHARSVTVVAGQLADSAGVRGAAALILSDAPRQLANMPAIDQTGNRS